MGKILRITMPKTGDKTMAKNQGVKERESNFTGFLYAILETLNFRRNEKTRKAFLGKRLSD